MGRRSRRTAYRRVVRFPHLTAGEIGAQSAQQLALRRLLQVDAEAQARQQEAHTSVHCILTESEEAARRRVVEARAAAEDEAQQLRAEARLGVEAEAEELRRQTVQTVDAMRANARTHRFAAAALLAAWVKAEHSP